MKKKLIYIFTGKRGGFSHFIPMIESFNVKKNFNYRIIVSDMHLSKDFGKTINEIKFHSKNIIKLKKPLSGDSVNDRLFTISSTITEMGKVYSKKKPDFIMLLGDRAEVLGAAIASLHHNVPIIHFYGGDITQGGTDEPTRHAISKLSNLHFVSNRRSLKNLIQLGEERWRVHEVGLLSLDLIRSMVDLKINQKLLRKYNLNPKKPYVILIQHPVTWELKYVKTQINETLKALQDIDIQTIAIYPCSDPGYKTIIKAYKKQKKRINFKLYKNIKSKDFYNLLSNSTLLIGNSSCGITECGFLKKYVINIGNRQEGRLSGKNVFNVSHNSKKIKILLKKILRKPKIKKIFSDYGDGNSMNEINKILNIKYNNINLIKKNFVELNK